MNTSAILMSLVNGWLTVVTRFQTPEKARPRCIPPIETGAYQPACTLFHKLRLADLWANAGTPHRGQTEKTGGTEFKSTRPTDHKIVQVVQMQGYSLKLSQGTLPQKFHEIGSNPHCPHWQTLTNYKDIDHGFITNHSANFTLRHKSQLNQLDRVGASDLASQARKARG